MAERLVTTAGSHAWQLLLDTLHELVLVVDGAGLVSAVNPAAARLLGATPSDLEGTRFTDLASQDPDRLTSMLDSARSGAPARARSVALRGRGADTLLDLRATALDDGRTGDVLVCGRDVTENTETQRALAEMGEMLDRLQELGAIGLWVWDVDSDTVQWSEAMHRLHGVAPNTFGGTLAEHVDVIAAEARSTVEAALRRTASTGEPFDEEFPARGADGRTIWVHARAEPRSDPERPGVAVQGIHQDLTERIAAERQMGEALARERKAVEELRHADRLKDEFLDTVSHEFRTPLSIVSGYAEVLLRDLEADTGGTEDTAESDVEGSLDAILRNARQLQGMVAQILDMSRLEAGRVEVQPTRLTLAEVVDQAVADGSEALSAHDVVVDVPDDVDVYADPMACSRVLANLLTNAAKFSDPGSPIEVRADVRTAPTEEPTEEPVGEVLVSISDEGVGIAEDQLDDLFERFTKADKGDPSKEGFGLGLAIARQYVELQRGRLWVESVEGVGSTFSFTIPVWRDT